MKRTLAAALSLAASSLAAAADEAADTAAIVAAQVRSQGFACAEPVSAVRDEANSKPDQAAYVLTCADAAYNVRLIPDEAAVIAPVQ